MNTMTIRMSDEDATLVCELVNFEGVTTSDFVRTAILEKIEDSYDLHELRATITVDNGQEFSVNEILEEL